MTAPEQPVRYRSPDEDSARWLGFPYRPGDIVISSRSKTGTTWVQMICALLVFQTPDLPAPLSQLSPWLDWLIVPREEVFSQLAAQPHRRFIKTHSPLDGLPLDDRATYIVTGRHPLDAAVSLFHQGENIDRARLRSLTGQPPRSGERPPPPPLHDRLVAWVDGDDRPEDYLDSLPGFMWHLSDAWRRRAEPNVVMVHYADLERDLDAEMRRLAAVLGIEVAEKTWSSLVNAARFEQMRARADQLAPDPAGIFKDKGRFFRRGGSGAGPEVLSAEELAHYYDRTAKMAEADMLAWLHR